MHRLPGKKLWWISVAAWFAAFSGFDLLFAGYKSIMFFVPVLAATLAGGIFSAIYIGILKVIIQGKRNREFERTYLPAFQMFLQESTPELLTHFPSSPSIP